MTYCLCGKTKSRQKATFISVIDRYIDSGNSVPEWWNEHISPHHYQFFSQVCVVFPFAALLLSKISWAKAIGRVVLSLRAAAGKVGYDDVE